MKGLRAAGPGLAILLVLVMQPGAAAKPGPSLAYQWPIRPFDVRHPVRAAFGDPRTLGREERFGVTRPDAGKYSFHNGIDIDAAENTPVYPVVSGRVVVARADEIVVQTNDGRTFQYWHLLRVVNRGEKVFSKRTVLGYVQWPWEHVHLAEIDGRHAQNPLAPGHLEPYRDDTRPAAVGLFYYDGHGPVETRGGRLETTARLAVAAEDAPPLSEPGKHFGLPQVPALVEWRLLHRGAWTDWQVAASFLRTVPPTWRFWQVYAPGTYQNSPVFEHKLYEGTPGRYLFRLGVDLHRLLPGRSRLEVRVADIRGNSATASWPLRSG